MVVRMITTAAGPGGVWPAGSLQRVDKEQASVLIEFGYAVAAEQAGVPSAAPLTGAQIEMAALDPVAEVADAPAQRKPRRKSARTKKA